MDKSILSQYTDLKKEIKLHEKKLAELRERKESIVSDTVISAAEAPYSPHPVKITGYDEKTYKRRIKAINRLIEQIQTMKDNALDLECEVYLYIQTIPDSRTRQIFIMRFVDKMEEWKIGNEVGMSESGVSKLIANYLEKN